MFLLHGPIPYRIDWNVNNNRAVDEQKVDE